MTPFKSKFSVKEEIANSITHGIGAALSLAGLIVLIILAAQRGTAWHIVSFSVYGASLFALYMASTLYHAIQKIKIKRVLYVLDQIAIYLLIAGTYTPFTLITLRGGWGWSIFGVIWGLAIAGITLRLFFQTKDWVSTIIYVVMAWVIIIAIKPLLSNLSVGGLIWLGIGSLSYMLGIIFFLWKKIPHHHAIWHLFVLGGSIGHFVSILCYTLPR